MTVFDVFEETSYTFLQLGQGGLLGNTVINQSNHTGIFKLRNGFQSDSNVENVDSDATLHVRPEEQYFTTVGENIIGHGIRKNGEDYRIIGQTGGDNFDTNVREHYTLTLKRESISTAS